MEIREMYQDEMKRTAPPGKCQGCELEEDCPSWEHLMDNRAELYRKFAMIPANFGQYVWMCKKCLITAFSREGLYRIRSDNGKVRMAWVTESVRCICGCGTTWRRKEIEAVRIPISGGAENG
jgi:hypothetical protein